MITEHPRLKGSEPDAGTAHSSSTGSRYADYAPATPLVPFGFGLSYSNFTFANVALGSHSTISLATDSSFNVSLDITNTGKMDGKIVVQVYFSQDLASRVRFSKMLLGECRHEILRDDNDKHEHSLFLFQNKIVYRVSCIIIISSAD